MSSCRRLSLILISVLLASLARPCLAYVDLAPTIAKVIEDAKVISIIEFSSLDRQSRLAFFKELKTLKGQSGTAPLVHQVAIDQDAIIPRAIIQWAQPGAHAIIFSSTRTAVVCIGQYWYQLKLTGTSWKLGADRPELALTYYGSVARLESALKKILAGGDGVLTILPHLVQESVGFDFSLNRIAYPALIRLERVRANLRMPGTVWRVSNSPDYVLGMGPVDDEDLPELIKQLQSADPEARAAAADDIRQLTDITGAAKTSPAIGPLENCLADSSPRVRCLAAGTLLRITHGHDGALKLLINALTSTEPILRRDGASACAVTGRAATPLVPLLGKLLSDPDDSIRFAALQSLGSLGPVALPARDAVLPLLNDKDAMIEAADALGHMGPRAQPVPPRLAEMLRTEQLTVRLAALRSMAQIGGKEALPAADVHRARNQRGNRSGFLQYGRVSGAVGSDCQ